MARPDLLAPLEERDFARLWLGQIVSNAGDWVSYVALTALVWDLTGSAWMVAGLFADAASVGPVLAAAAVALLACVPLSAAMLSGRPWPALCSLMLRPFSCASIHRQKGDSTHE